jgi:nucleoside-diphosphate kinase
MSERTLVILKPDTVSRGFMGEIISRFEKKGFRLAGVRLLRFDEALCRVHYAHLADKPFFPEIVEYMTSGPSLAMIWEGAEAVEVVRKMIGPTNPAEAPHGTIRGDFALTRRQNAIHASDSVIAAEEEILRFFPADCRFAPKSEA